MRPPLRLRTACPVDEALRRLREAAGSPDAEVTGSFVERYVVLRIPETQQHFGSPQLTFEVSSDAEGSTLSGLFMPMPSIWTGFVALYALIVFAGFVGLMYGWAQVQLGDTPHALWAVPTSLVLLSLVYGAACVGQMRGSKQMHYLRAFVEEALKENQGKT